MCLVIFLPGNVGNVSVPSGFARFRFMRCAATGTTNFAVMFAPVPGRGPAHLSDRYSDFQQRFCRFSDSD